MTNITIDSAVVERAKSLPDKFIGKYVCASCGHDQFTKELK